VNRNAIIASGVVVAGALAWAFRDKIAGALGRGVVGAADSAIAGTVEGVGSLFGIPATDQAQAAIDRRNGDVWAASFSMPAGEWISWVWNGAPTGGATGTW